MHSNCDPSNPLLWCSLGILFYQLNEVIIFTIIRFIYIKFRKLKYLDALDAYSRAITANPNITEVWYNVGILYDTCSQPNDAKDAYQKALELGTNSQFVRDRLALLKVY